MSRISQRAQQSAPRQIILGAHFPGVNSTTVWSDPASGSHIDFDSFRRFAESAERGRFDFLFLAEGLRLREQRGQIHDLDVVGRPDTLPVLSGLAAVTRHLGLAGTINTTFNEPYEVARQFASLDALSGGRAAWNMVTSSDAFTGENFRRGGYLPRERRYLRAEEFLDAAETIWSSVARTHRRLDIHSSEFDITGHYDGPVPPQGRPVIFQAGDSAEGRSFAARRADAVFTRHSSLEQGRAFTADIRRRAGEVGRGSGEVKVLPGVTVVVADTDAEAEELAADIRRRQISGQNALLILERVWNRDLSSYDPDGPLPEIPPETDDSSLSQGRVQHITDREAEVARLRELSARQGLSLRETVIADSARQNFVGSPETIAQGLIEHVEAEACDGFILVPHLSPTGLDPFVDRVVPLLQERGALRQDYPQGHDLRSLMNLSPR